MTSSVTAKEIEVVVQGAPSEPQRGEQVVSGTPVRMMSKKQVKKDGPIVAAFLVMGGLCGAIPGIVLLVMYNNFGGLEAGCDRPIAYWLLVTGCVALGTMGLNLLATAFTLCYGETDEDGKRKKPPSAQCIECLSAAPGIFAIYWFIKGNYDVWGTFPINQTVVDSIPRINITDYTQDGNLPLGSGCDETLLGGARGWLIFCFAFGPALIVCLCCCACFLFAIGAKAGE